MGGTREPASSRQPWQSCISAALINDALTCCFFACCCVQKETEWAEVHLWAVQRCVSCEAAARVGLCMTCLAAAPARSRLRHCLVKLHAAVDEIGRWALLQLLALPPLHAIGRRGWGGVGGTQRERPTVWRLAHTPPHPRHAWPGLATLSYLAAPKVDNKGVVDVFFNVILAKTVGGVFATSTTNATRGQERVPAGAPFATCA